MEDSRDKEKPVYKGIDENDFLDKLRKNPWIVSTMVLGLLVLTLLFFNVRGAGIPGVTGQVVSGETVGEQLLELYKSTGANELSINSIEEVSGVYKINFEYQGTSVPIYATKDGKLAGSLREVVAPVPSSDGNNETTTPENVPKSDKPIVELFVMTHCPYGTQAEKGIIPTIKALGSRIDANIRFVHYFMHGDKEEQETYKQVCIREEQSTKYLNYLECFLEDGDSERCLGEAGIDKAKMNSCVSSGKAKEYYTKDSELSKKYGVGGSPTLVINGEIVNSARSSSAYLDTICGAFNEEPSVCDNELSSSTPSPGFGSGTAGSGTQAQCL